MTSAPHPGVDEFSWYLRHGLRLALQDWPSPRLQAFEDHVSGCDGCSALLSSEAQGELVLQDLALEGPNRTRGAAGRWAYAAVAALIHPLPSR